MHVAMIGDLVFTDQKVLGPRNCSMFTRRSVMTSRPTHKGKGRLVNIGEGKVWLARLAREPSPRVWLLTSSAHARESKSHQGGDARSRTKKLLNLYQTLLPG